MRLVDVGAGGGLIDQYLLEKYALDIRAYDVVAPKDNIFAYETQKRVPVRLFNGSHLPLEADLSADAVLFNAVLHHAAHHTRSLLSEAERISRRWILLVEDVTVRGERNPREKHIHVRHKQHGKPPFKGAPEAIFRPQQEWVRLLQASGAFTVTRVGAVVARNLSHEFRLQHRLANHWNPYEYVGPTYQRYFVAERCVGSS